MEYKSPPITEAVIGISFSSPIEDDSLQSALKKFHLHYPNVQSVSSFDVAVDIANEKQEPVTDVSKQNGHRLSTADMTQLLVIWPTSFSISQLAPYSGWDQFIERFIRDWKLLKRITGHQLISRIGVRYINRVDIPYINSEAEYEKYLNVYPHLPSIFNAIDSYAIQTIARLETIGCMLRLNTGRIASPLIDHASFIFDTDIYKDSDPPQNDTDIIDLLNKIRDQKNTIFEASISDRSRELFQ